MAANNRTSHRDKAYVYHLTHVDNLASIAQHGLLSRGALGRRGLAFTDVASAEILNGRSLHGLDEYVPLHFIHQSPFDGAVVAAARDKRFVLLAVRRTLARQQGWRVVVQHPLTNGDPPEILDWDEGVARIEWGEMDKYPRDYESDHHCKMVCMAEALAPGSVSMSSIAAIYTPSSHVHAIVQDQFVGRTTPHINLNPEMFPRSCR